MKITLKKGETLSIGFDDSEEDVFLISYSETRIEVAATLPGNVFGDAGVIYREVFALSPNWKEEEEEES